MKTWGFTALLFLALPVSADIQLGDPVFKPHATVDYLIIAPSDPAFLTQAERLADLKWECGLQVRIEVVDSIALRPGKDIEEKIRSCIQSYYADSGLTWLLLLGDYLKVPARRITNADSLPGDYSDSYYACLEGKWDIDGDGFYGEEPSYIQYTIKYALDSSGYLVPVGVVPQHVGLDIWPDVYVGRLPASNAAEAGVMVDKIIRYSTDYRQTARAKDIMLFGARIFDTVRSPDNLFIDDVANYFHYDIKPIFKAAGSVFANAIVHERYQDRITAGDTVENDSVAITRDTVAALLSQGSNLVEFCAHGNPESIWICSPDLIPKREFTIPDVMAVTSPTLSNVIGISCGLMGMPPESTMCFGKAFLANPSGGAVSFCGSGTLLLQDPAWVLTKSAVQSLCTGAVTRVACAMQFVNAGFAESDRLNMYYDSFWGDPEMELWTKLLSADDTIALSVGRNGSQFIVVASPKVDSILVSIREPGGRFMRSYTKAGIALFDTVIPKNDTLVVSAAVHNLLPSSLRVKASEIPLGTIGSPRLKAGATTLPFVSVQRGNQISIRSVSGAQVTIFDVAGHVRYRGACAGQIVDTRLRPGLYVARLNSSVGHEVEAFCIDR